MSDWDRLRIELLDLLEKVPCGLSSFPDPNGRGPHDPPYQIGMAAWAVGAAESLHNQFGTTVELRLGFMPFPGPAREPRLQRQRDHRSIRADSLDLHVEVDVPLTVRSGHSTTAPVWVTNRSAERRVLQTNGHLRSRVVDEVGATVGAYAGAQTLALVQFSVEPGARAEVPVLIGTASIDPALGYAIPPGQWSIEVDLELGDHTVSAQLPLTIGG